MMNNSGPKIRPEILQLWIPSSLSYHWEELLFDVYPINNFQAKPNEDHWCHNNQFSYKTTMPDPVEGFTDITKYS